MSHAAGLRYLPLILLQVMERETRAMFVSSMLTELLPATSVVLALLRPFIIYLNFFCPGSWYEVKGQVVWRSSFLESFVREIVLCQLTGPSILSKLCWPCVRRQLQEMLCFLLNNWVCLFVFVCVCMCVKARNFHQKSFSMTLNGTPLYFLKHSFL